MTMSYCAKCGSELDEKDNFCSDCGAVAKTVTSEISMSSAQAPIERYQTGLIELGSISPAELIGGNTKTFTQVNFPKPFPAGSKVIVIPMVQSFNGAHTPGLRIADVTNIGFKIRINEVVCQPPGHPSHPLSDGTHVTESIGYVAYIVDEE
jgi:hypothetical protein